MAVADDILAAVKTLVEAEFATEKLKCHTRRASEKNPAFAPGTAVPCFVASANDDRPTEMAWVGKKFVRYSVLVEFLTKELPGQRAPSVTVEGALDRVSRLFLTAGMAGVSDVSDVNVRPRAPYQMPYADPTVSAAGVLLTVEVLENAN